MITVKWKKDISRDANVTIKVYDMLGREVATIVNDQKSAGWHEVEFSTKGISTSGGLSSGVYVYKIRAGKFMDVKQMLLMK